MITMEHRVTLLPSGRTLTARDGENLLDVLRRADAAPDAPCGGNGTCGKCAVTVDGGRVLACGCLVRRDMTVTTPPARDDGHILTAGQSAAVPLNPVKPGYLAAYDIGTTTVVCFLMDPEGRTAATESMLNPQRPFGADVISRIRRSQKGDREALTDAIRRGMTALLEKCCKRAGVEPGQTGVVSVVGNPCMQQLFLGMDVDNLASVPFAPALTSTRIAPAREVLPVCENAVLLTVPDISGYVGADTMGCILASRLYAAEDTVLMVDIGTNGEMVLSRGGRMAACSTAAGPALEGANIQHGMRGSEGAIDHVTAEGCTVIGGGKARGICGSGLIDAVAVMLDRGLLNRRGRVLTEDHTFPLRDGVVLTQEDIRQVQLAKGAIAAGIRLMAEHMDIRTVDIDRVILAGAFGSCMNPASACRIGLLPEELAGRITAAGNIAGSGSRMLAKDRDQLELAQTLVGQIEFLELADMPAFRRAFAKNMEFRESSHGKMD